ncbi:MAG: hypothetical protein GKS01_18580 [Alphaproteobacteria bacterium]|nr:hypothetical protein [Alphaproteobacteria bacterium]
MDDTKGNAVLFSEMTPPTGREDEFNDWYDGHHSPSHVQGVPGFRSAMRYQSPEGPHFLAVYELEGPETLEHEEYKKRKLTPDNPTYEMLKSVSGFTRYIATEQFTLGPNGGAEAPLDAAVIFCALFTVPMEARGEFEEWFDTEHAPMLQQNAGWLFSRRFDIIDQDPEPHTHLIIHYLDGPEALEAPERAAASDTEWRHRLAEQPWFSPTVVTYLRRNKRFLKSG